MRLLVLVHGGHIVSGAGGWRSHGEAGALVLRIRVAQLPDAGDVLWLLRRTREDYLAGGSRLAAGDSPAPLSSAALSACPVESVQGADYAWCPA